MDRFVASTHAQNACHHICSWHLLQPCNSSHSNLDDACTAAIPTNWKPKTQYVTHQVAKTCINQIMWLSLKPHHIMGLHHTALNTAAHQ